MIHLYYILLLVGKICQGEEILIGERYKQLGLKL